MTSDAQSSEVADLEPSGLTSAAAHPPPAGWRLLHVEDDSVEALKVKLALRYELPLGSTLDHVYSLDDACQRLQSASYDAVVVSHCFADSDGDEPLRRLIQNPDGTPVVILSGDSQARAALAAGRCGRGSSSRNQISLASCSASGCARSSRSTTVIASSIPANAGMPPATTSLPRPSLFLFCRTVVRAWMYLPA